MPTDDVLCPVHGDAALDPNDTSGALLSCQACARVAARLVELQALARALPVSVPQAVDRDVIRARIVAAAPTVVPTSSGGAPARTARTTRVRWGLGLGLFAGAALAVVGFVVRPRHESTRANATASNPIEPPQHEPDRVPAPAVTTTPATATTATPAVAARKKAPAPVSPPARRTGALAAEHPAARRANTEGAPPSKNADSPPPPVAGPVEIAAPSPAPAPDQPAALAPTLAPAANAPHPEMARDERAPTSPVASGGGQNSAGPAAAATATVRAAIVSAPASAGSNPPGPTPAAAASNAPASVPAAAQTSDRLTDHATRDERAQDRAQRRQDMRERRREERVRRVERRH